MPDCDYCEASFDDEDAYLGHLADEHEGELGRIDRRRVEEFRDGGSGIDPVTVAALAVGVVLVALVAYAAGFIGGNGGGGGGGDAAPMQDPVQQPTDLRSVHYHGQINVTIGGRTLDFTRSRYQNPGQYPYFHFEGGEARWHAHGQGITLEYALETLGIGVTNTSLSFEGTVYNGSESGTTVEYYVNGERVNPETYVLQDQDSIKVVASKDDSV